MKKDGSKETRGGKRAGAGAKPVTRVYSDEIKTKLADELFAKAKETGRSWLAELVDMAYQENTGNNSKLGALKLVADILVVKETHKTVEEFKGGVIELPAERPVEESAPAIQ